jgi:hypothetical protein
LQSGGQRDDHGELLVGESVRTSGAPSPMSPWRSPRAINSFEAYFPNMRFGIYNVISGKIIRIAIVTMVATKNESDSLT